MIENPVKTIVEAVDIPFSVLFVQNFVVGAIITPLVQGLKKFAFLDAVKPQFITAFFCMLAVWGVNTIFGQTMATEAIINGGLMAAGMATITHATYQGTSNLIKKKE